MADKLNGNFTRAIEVEGYKWHPDDKEDYIENGGNLTPSEWWAKKYPKPGD